jgi:hypothetical protein
VYDVEEWVAPKKLKRLADGTKLQFAVERQLLIVKAPEGKTCKLKILANYAHGQ